MGTASPAVADVFRCIESIEVKFRGAKGAEFCIRKLTYICRRMKVVSPTRTWSPRYTDTYHEEALLLIPAW